MVEEGDRVLAAVSGGADSVCLLLVLQELQSVLGFDLRSIHIEHGIRGEESLADAAFVERLCRKIGVECATFPVDARTEAERTGCTLEEAARNLRYGILEREAREWGGAKVAIAHNREDDAETVLFHLARGSGMAGMRGILPVRGKIIRPLLHTGREEILAYLAQKGQGYCVDRTNSDPYYSRNRIRSKVLPQLREINEGAVLHIQEWADRMKGVSDYLRRQVEAAMGMCAIRKEGGIFISEMPFFSQDEALRDEILRAALLELAGSGRDIGQVHIRLLEGLFSRQPGRRLAMPYALVAYREHGGIFLGKGEEHGAVQAEYQLRKQDLEQAQGGWVQAGPFSFRLLENVNFLGNFGQKTYTKWFDYGKIKDNLLVRHRREGDYLCFDEQGHRQKLRRYLANEKVEARKRDAIWLLADGPHILWAVGYRASSYYRIKSDTKRIMEARFDALWQEGESCGQNRNDGRGMGMCP